MIRRALPLLAVACFAAKDVDEVETSHAVGDTSTDTGSEDEEYEDPWRDFDTSIVPEGPTPCREPVSGVVDEVIDGDTIKVATGRGIERVRLIGVNTPEVDHTGPDDDCYGEEAKAYVEGALDGQPIWLGFDTECEDHFGRTLAYVHTGQPQEEAFFQRRLLLGGWAATLEISPNTAYAGTFGTAEAAARTADAGMWGECP